MSEVENGLNTCVSDLDTNGFFPSPPFVLATPCPMLSQPYGIPYWQGLDYNIPNYRFYVPSDLIFGVFDLIPVPQFCGNRPIFSRRQTVTYITFSSHHWCLLQSISLIVHSSISVSDTLEQQQFFLTRNRDWTLLSWCPWAGTTRDVPL